MKITVEMVMAKKTCPYYTLERLSKLAGDGLTLLEILNLDIPEKDRIWAVTRFLPDIENRKFAIWCAKSCKSEIPEIIAYIYAIERFYMLKTGTEEKMISASWAAYSASYQAADSASYQAADSAAYKAADWAASRAAYSAAYSAAYRAAHWAAYGAAYGAAYWAAYGAADSAAYGAAAAYGVCRESQLAYLREICARIEEAE